MEKSKKYNIGLDIGTQSVGWAVTDPTTNKILKLCNKKMWGVRLFDEGKSASTRRGFRNTRRRYDRRRQRIHLLQEIFEPEINKIDNSFFIRLQDGFLNEEDKLAKLSIENNNSEEILKHNNFKYNIFIDEKYNDKDFYNEYPTIYHLRYHLMNHEVNDLRLVYLAMHHIIKYRGNFIHEDKNNFDVKKIDISYKLETIFEDIKTNYDVLEINDYTINYDIVQNILIDKKIKKLDKIKQITEEINPFFVDKKAAKSIASLMCGGKVNILELFLCEPQNDDEANKAKISFEDADYEEKMSVLETTLDKYVDLIDEFNGLYSDVYLYNIFGDIENPTISYYMISKYNKHKSDKELLKKYLTKEDKKAFFSESGIYELYVKNPKCCSYEVLCKELKRILSNYTDDEIKKQILSDIDDSNFLPKINDTNNGRFPFQLNLNELNEIIEKQGNRFPFLKEKLPDGTYKIAKLLSFRIPYFVGPLNKCSDKAWLVKNIDEKITPYNFDEVVNKIESANKFIIRMTSDCTYLYGKKAMPTNSLLYSKYKVLNEIKQIKINGKNISIDIQKKMFNDLFLRYSKITDKIFRSWLVEIKYIDAPNIKEITGYQDDNKFASNLKSYIDFIKIFGKEYVDNNTEIIENLIKWITIFEDKKILREKIKIEYPEIDNETLNKICALKYKGWSSLSRELLTEVYYRDEVTNNQHNIIELLENTEKNFMQILYDKKYKFIDKINELNSSSDTSDITIEDVQNLMTSPANKRAIWQSIKIIKEIVKLTGHNPEHIYIEMARGEEEKKRKDTRLKQLLTLYENCKKDADNYNNIIIEDCNRLYSELKTKDKIDSDKLFLYYLQQGKSLYSGKEITLDQLNDCEIDHIIPQSLIKDDSLDNRALVLREENQAKKNSTTLPDEFRNNPKARELWEVLRKGKFISERKYHNLTRKEFNEKDIEGFINRQLVETRQITKHVANLLNNLYNKGENVSSEKTVVQFINANISHNYREKYELYKYRQINNYHHAHDAYLAAVIGNYKTILFTNSDIKELSLEYKEKIKNKENKYNNYGLIVDSIENDIYNDSGEVLFDSENFKRVVINNMYNQDILTTKKTEIKDNEFYDQTIYKKGVGKIPLKKDLPAEKYGGYNSANSSYMALIKYTNKNEEKIKLIGIPIMYTSRKNNNMIIDSYIKDTINKEKYTIIKDKIAFNSLIKYENSLYYISGYSIAHKDFELINATELKLYKHDLIKYRYLLNCICNNKYPNYQLCFEEEIENNCLKIFENNKAYWNKIFNNEINELFDVLLDIMQKEYSAYCNSTLSKLRIVQNNKEFNELDSFEDKKNIILQIFNLLAAKPISANLTALKSVKFNKDEGRTRKTINKSFTIYYQSITGLKEVNHEFQNDSSCQ